MVIYKHILKISTIIHRLTYKIRARLTNINTVILLIDNNLSEIYSKIIILADALSILGIVIPTDAPIYVGSHTINLLPLTEM